MTHPRTTPPIPGQKLIRRLQATPGLPASGPEGTRPINAAPLGIDIPGVMVVVHGDNPNVERPTAVWVLWVGAADPGAAFDYDGRYPVTL